MVVTGTKALPFLSTFDWLTGAVAKNVPSDAGNSPGGWFPPWFSQSAIPTMVDPVAVAGGLISQEIACGVCLTLPTPVAVTSHLTPFTTNTPPIQPALPAVGATIAITSASCFTTLHPRMSYPRTLECCLSTPRAYAR